MRINRPDGISQENRSHPFFILLRRFSDEQREMAMRCSKDFVLYSIFTGLVFLPLLFTLFFDWVYVIAPLSLLTGYGFIIRDRYQHLKNLLASTNYDEVEHMIYSNDYQMTNLNMEKMINMMTQCTRITGGLQSFLYETHHLFWSAGLISVILILLETIIFFVR